MLKNNSMFIHIIFINLICLANEIINKTMTMDTNFLLVSRTAEAVPEAKSKKPIAGFARVPTMPFAKPLKKP